MSNSIKQELKTKVSLTLDVENMTEDEIIKTQEALEIAAFDAELTKAKNKTEFVLDFIKAFKQ